MKSGTLEAFPAPHVTPVMMSPYVVSMNETPKDVISHGGH